MEEEKEFIPRSENNTDKILSVIIAAFIAGATSVLVLLKIIKKG